MLFYPYLLLLFREVIKHMVMSHSKDEADSMETDEESEAQLSIRI